MTDDELREMDQWITPTEAAGLAGLARSTIVKYALNTERAGTDRWNHRLPEVRTMKKGGRARLVFRPDVMRLGEGRV